MTTSLMHKRSPVQGECGHIVRGAGIAGRAEVVLDAIIRHGGACRVLTGYRLIWWAARVAENTFV